MALLLKDGKLNRMGHSLVKTRLAERSLHEFSKQAWEIVEPGRQFCDGWHLAAMAEHLEAMTKGDILKLIINIPPRSMKSLSVAVFWFCWSWIHWPESRWLYSSYAAELSVRDSRKCRDIIASDWYRERWGDRFSLTLDCAHRFENTRRGMRMSTSITGKATGEGGDVLVTDDPHKADEVYSRTNRHKVANWWDTTMSTRGSDPKKTRRLVVMQRLHEGDLTGHLLSEARGYDHLVLPCRYEDDHPHKIVSSLGFTDPRAEGGTGLLWPERFGEEEVADLEKQMGGSYNVAGQLQQRPAPAEGGMFREALFSYFREDDIEVGDGSTRRLFTLTDRQGKERKLWSDECFWFQTCDTALKTGEENAYTVVMTFALHHPTKSLCVYDVFRDRVPVPEQYGMLMKQRAKYPQLKFQAIEDQASGTGLIQEGRVQGTPFRALKAVADKVSRCTSVCTQYENGMVFHKTPAQANWNEKFEHELLVFPMSEYADQVDCLAYGGMVMQMMQVSGMYEGRTLSYVKKETEKEEVEVAGKRLQPKRGRGTSTVGGDEFSQFFR